MDIQVYGIENPLIDILTEVSEEDLRSLNAEKGIMHLIDLERREEILSFIKHRKAAYICGGSGPNTILALSSFGINSAIAGKVGNDRFGSIYKKQLSAYQALDHIISENGPTGSSIILVTPDCERTMNTFLGVNRNFGPDDIDEKTLGSSKYFYTTGYMWDTELQKAAVTKALEISKKNSVEVAFDVADPFAVKRSKSDFLRILRNNVSIAFANSEEAGILFDTNNVNESLRALSSLVDFAVVKDGERGSYVSRNGDSYFIPPRDIVPADSTGAGDMYAAGFLYGVCSGFSAYESGVCASYFASEIVRQFGAQFSEEKRNSFKEIIETKAWNYLQKP